MKTPIEILDEMIEEIQQDIRDMPDFGGGSSEAYGKLEGLEEVKERIEKECTIRISGGDNDYDIPYGLITQFNKDCHCDFQEPDEEWYEWCDKFNDKYSQYQV